MIPSKNTALFVQECEKRNISYILHTPYVLEVQTGEGFFCADTRTPLQSSALTHICKMKYITKQILDEHHIPTAPWKVIWRDKIEFPSHLSGPLICKPVDKQKSRGLMKNVTDLEGVQKYFSKFPEEYRILAEETLKGKEYRILLIERKVLGVIEKRKENGTKIKVDVTAQMTREVEIFFENIAHIFRADVLGIDIIMEDISKVPQIKNHHGIVELNSAPGFHPKAFPEIAERAAKAVFDLILCRVR
ncbi:MAG: RimK family alpha-L-glutamate ligase [Candidatus Gracilibacteria bacterium]